MKNWVIDPNSPSTAEGMILRLAGMCNHASTNDGAGFSKADAEFGHSLALRAAENRAWTPKQAAAALSLIKKYHRQLGGQDAIQSWLLSPIFRNDPASVHDAGGAKSKKRVMRKEGASALLEFEYDANLVRETKLRLTGETSGKRYRPLWNPDAKCWTVQLNDASIPLLKEFADAFGFEISEDLALYFEKSQEQSEEDRFMLALNDNRNVVLAMDKIVIIVDNPAIMEEFQSVLGHN